MISFIFIHPFIYPSIHPFTGGLTCDRSRLRRRDIWSALRWRMVYTGCTFLVGRSRTCDMEDPAPMPHDHLQCNVTSHLSSSRSQQTNQIQPYPRVQRGNVYSDPYLGHD